jgi:hypothetical protein
MFFFEKKNQKTFGLGFSPVANDVYHKSKVFCFFFSKKKCFRLAQVDRCGDRWRGLLFEAL